MAFINYNKMNKFSVFVFLLTLLCVSTVFSLHISKKKNLKLKSAKNSIKKLAKSKASFIKKNRQEMNHEVVQPEPTPFDTILSVVREHYDEFARGVFEEVDKDRSGLIDQSEFLEGFKFICDNLFIPDCSKETAEQLFAESQKRGEVNERNFVEELKGLRDHLLHHLESIEHTHLRLAIDIKMEAHDIRDKVHKARDQIRSNVDGAERKYFEDSLRGLLQDKESIRRDEVRNYLSFMFNSEDVNNQVDIEGLEREVFDRFDVNKDQTLDRSEVRELVLSFDEEVANSLDELSNYIAQSFFEEMRNNHPEQQPLPRQQ